VNNEIVGKVIISCKTIINNDGSGPLSLGSIVIKVRQQAPKISIVKKMISLKFINLNLNTGSIVCAQRPGIGEGWALELRLPGSSARFRTVC